MIKRVLVLFTLLNLVLVTHVPGQTKSQDKGDKARQAALKISSSSKDLAEVKMLSGEKHKGRITSVGTDSFTFADEKSGASQTISFSDVDQIKKHKKGLGTGAWIAIAAGAAGAIVLIAIYRTIYCNEQAC